jgi:hypothetical protein
MGSKFASGTSAASVELISRPSESLASSDLHVWSLALVRDAVARVGSSIFQPFLPDIEVVAITADAPSRPGLATTAKPSGLARKYRWLVTLWAVVAAFTAVTALRSYQVGVPLRDPSGAVFTLRLLLSLALLALLSLVDAGARIDRRGWSLGRLGGEFRRRWSKDRVIVAVSGLVAYHIVYACYSNLKSWVAFRHPMDDQLLGIDKALVGGRSPAVLLHDLFGQHVAAHVFAGIYESFSYLVPVSFVAALVFANRIREGCVFLSSAIWVWILGLGTYYLIPSLGPFASASRDFAGLDHTRITATQAQYMAERAQLLSHPAAGDSFASISAFASLHVGFTCMILLMLRYYGFSRAASVMTVYLIAVMISTIYLGWHFVVDDAAGLALAAAAVALGRFTTYPRRGRPA